MFEAGTWPYRPTSLSDIIESETLAVIESGCTVRLGRPLTILDYDPLNVCFTDRIDSINGLDSYSAFCRRLRDCPFENKLCVEADEKQAMVSLEQFLENGEAFRPYPCRMQLLDMTHIIRVKEQPVAMLISGQYRPRDGLEAVHSAIDATVDDPSRRRETTRVRRRAPASPS